MTLILLVEPVDGLRILFRSSQVGGFVSLCVPAAAEIAGKPWVSLQLTGLPFMSAMDPPVHPAAASSLWARGRAPLVWQVARTVALSGVPRQMMREAGAVLMEERARRGLEPGDGDVMLETVSPFLTLGAQLCLDMERTQHSSAAANRSST